VTSDEVTYSPPARGGVDAKQTGWWESLTAKDTNDAKENRSRTAKDAKDAKGH
jgi:hypothetical protein